MTTILLDSLPPSVNSLFTNVTGKGRVRTDRYRVWANAMGWQLKAQRPEPVKGHIALEIVCVRKDNRKRDLSNFIKALEDLLVTHGVIEDDAKVDDLRIRYGAVIGCVVTITGIAS